MPAVCSGCTVSSADRLPEENHRVPSVWRSPGGGFEPERRFQPQPLAVVPPGGGLMMSHQPWAHIAPAASDANSVLSCLAVFVAPPLKKHVTGHAVASQLVWGHEAVTTR